MQSLTKRKTKVTVATISAILLAAIMVLSGVGIYFKLNPRTKSPKVEVGPLDFSIDAWNGSVSATEFNESYAGRSEQTKTINSAASFVHFINEVNNGNTFENYTIYLNSNLDFKNQTISSIGTSEHPFKGVFDGGHYTIMNANIDGDGLFGCTENATIKNVGLYNSNTNLIDRAINTNIVNAFVRLGQGVLVNVYVSNNGEHSIVNSFVDTDVKGLINTIDTNSSSENNVTISNCYFTQGDISINNMVGSTFVTSTEVIKATSKSSFASWSYSSNYSTDKEWCDYDYLKNTQKLEFNYPLPCGFVKVFLTGSCYESVVVAGDTTVDVANLQEAFEVASQEKEAEINLIVEKVFMEARATLENDATIKINSVKDTTIVRGENNADSMFVGSTSSKIVIGGLNEVSTANGTNAQSTITLDGNREYFEENNIESGALVVSYGGQVEINDNVIIKDNINTNVKYGGAVLLYNTSEPAKIDATIENCSAEFGGGAIAVVGTLPESIGTIKNCSTSGNGGAIAFLNSFNELSSIEAVSSLYGSNLNVQPTTSTSVEYLLKDLSFEGNTAENGGAIYADNNINLTLNNVTFDNNMAEKGGAIYSNGNIDIVGDVVIKNNQNTELGYTEIYATNKISLDAEIYLDAKSENTASIGLTENNWVDLISIPKYKITLYKENIQPYSEENNNGLIFKVARRQNPQVSSMSTQQETSGTTNSTFDVVNMLDGYAVSTNSLGDGIVSIYDSETSNNYISCTWVNSFTEVALALRVASIYISESGTLQVDAINGYGRISIDDWDSSRGTVSAGDTVDVWLYGITTGSECVEIYFTPEWASSPEDYCWCDVEVMKGTPNITVSGVPSSLKHGESATITVSGFPCDGLLEYDSAYEAILEPGEALVGNGSVVNITITADITVNNVDWVSFYFVSDNEDYNSTDATTQEINIEKADGYINLKYYSYSCTLGQDTDYTDVSSSHGGVITASENHSYVSTSVSGTRINISGLSNFTTTATVYIIVTCEATTTHTSASATYTINLVKATPTITLSATSGTVAAGSSVTVTYKSTHAGSFSITAATSGYATIGTYTSSVSANSEKSVTITGSKKGTVTINFKFTPSNTLKVNSATKAYSLTVTQLDPGVTVGTVSTSLQIGGSTQFSYKASVAGTFAITSSNSSYVAVDSSYTKSVSANTSYTCILNAIAAGSATITITFTPTDNVKYATFTKTYSITVTKINPIITLSTDSFQVAKSTSDTFTYKSNVAGTFAITSASTSYLTVSPASTTASANTTNTCTVTAKTTLTTVNVTVKFTPTDTAKYNTITKTVSVQIVTAVSNTITYDLDGGTLLTSSALSKATAGSSYTFTLQSSGTYSGYYKSGNNGVHNSYSLAKFTFTATAPTVVFEVINYAESNFDFAIFSTLNSTLTSGYTADTSNVQKSFKGLSSSDKQYVSYNCNVGTSYYIYVKFRKDGSASSGNDCVYFKLYSGAGTTPNPSTYSSSTVDFTLTNPTKTDYTFLGWTGSNGETPQTSVTIPTGSKGNKTYTANFVQTILPDVESLTIPYMQMKTLRLTIAQAGYVYIMPYGCEVIYNGTAYGGTQPLTSLSITVDAGDIIELQIKTLVGSGSTAYLNLYMEAPTSATLVNSFNYYLTCVPADLNTPELTGWDSGKPTWNAVDNAMYYNVEVYKDGALHGSYQASNTYCEGSGMIGGVGVYTYRVQAVPSDTSLYNNSAWSAMSASLYVNEVNVTAGEGLSASLSSISATSFVAYSGMTESLTATLEEDYKFTSWSSKNSAVSFSNATSTTTTVTFGEMTSISPIEISASAEIDGYWVTIVSSDESAGTVSESRVIAPKNSTISVSGNTLTFKRTTVTATPKPATKEYTYSFGSWSNTSGTITAERTVTANFTKTKNTYTVTIGLNNSNYGSLSGTLTFTVEYGTPIIIDGNTIKIGDKVVTAIPADKTLETQYVLSQWDGANETIEGDTVITAAFVQQTAEYTVTLQSSGYGTTSVSSITAKYGDTIRADGNVLTIGSKHVLARPNADTVQYKHSLSSWSKTSGTISGDVTITATFTRAIQTYAVNISSNSTAMGTLEISGTPVTSAQWGTEIFISENTIKIGDTTYTATAKAGYEFGKWVGVVGRVDGNIVISAEFVVEGGGSVLTLNKTETAIDITENVDVTATSARNVAIRCESSNEDVVTWIFGTGGMLNNAIYGLANSASNLMENGDTSGLKIVGPGTATITVSVYETDGSTVGNFLMSQTFEITVTAPTIKFNIHNLEWKHGTSGEMGNSISVTTSAGGYISFTSSNADVVEFDSGFLTYINADTSSAGTWNLNAGNGILLSSVGEGTTTITAKFYKDSTKAVLYDTTTMTITVVDPKTIEFNKSQISITPDGPVGAGDFVEIGDLITFTTTAAGYIEFKSSTHYDLGIVYFHEAFNDYYTMSQAGTEDLGNEYMRLQAGEYGTATLTAYFYKDSTKTTLYDTATITITVVEPASTLSCNVSSITINSKEDFANIILTSSVNGTCSMSLSNSTVLSDGIGMIDMESGAHPLSWTYFNPIDNGTVDITFDFDGAGGESGSVTISVTVNAVATVSVSFRENCDNGYFYPNSDMTSGSELTDTTFTLWVGDSIEYYDPDLDDSWDSYIYMPSIPISLFPQPYNGLYELLGYDLYYSYNEEVSGGSSFIESGETYGSITIEGDIWIYVDAFQGEYLE